MRPYLNHERYQANLRLLCRQQAGLAGLAVAPASTRLVIDDSGELNVDLGGGGLLYPGDAKAAVGRQVEQYLAHPSRCRLVPGAVFEDSIEVRWVYDRMSEAMAAIPMAERSAPFAGFLVVFGLGLGHHVRLLAERLDVRTLIVVETHDEFINHSLHALDWVDFIGGLARQGRAIRFVRGPDPYSQIVDIINGPDFVLLDGSYLYQHYETPDYTTLMNRLFLQTRELTMLPGWVEDQLLLLRNNTANFASGGFLLQRNKVASARRLPAFVVGAGPSLDADMEIIRSLRGKVVLITASSALKVLLDHGIRPDIHCELENSHGLGDVALSLAARHGGLSDITLYATPTVNPRIAPCFGRLFLPHRPVFERVLRPGRRTDLIGGSDFGQYRRALRPVAGISRHLSVRPGFRGP